MTTTHETIAYTGTTNFYEVGAIQAVTDGDSTTIQIAALIDREPGESTIRELWIQRRDPNFYPFTMTFGRREHWREFAAAVNEIVAALEADEDSESDSDS